MRNSLILSLTGLVTSLLVGLCLWFIEIKFGIQLFSLMVWFLIPVGALGAGAAAGSGYYFGSIYLNLRPAKSMGIGVLMVSSATFFFVYWLGYRTAQVNGKSLYELVSYYNYLDWVLQNQSVQYYLGRGAIGEPEQVGKFGYVKAISQIIGFAIGGVAVYASLSKKPFCKDCLKYLKLKREINRYTEFRVKFMDTTSEVIDKIDSGNIDEAIALHANSFNEKSKINMNYKASLTCNECPSCRLNLINYKVEQLSKNDWNLIRGRAFTAEGGKYRF